MHDISALLMHMNLTSASDKITLAEHESNLTLQPDYESHLLLPNSDCNLFRKSTNLSFKSINNASAVRKRCVMIFRVPTSMFQGQPHLLFLRVISLGDVDFIVKVSMMITNFPDAHHYENMTFLSICFIVI